CCASGELFRASAMALSTPSSSARREEAASRTFPTRASPRGRRRTLVFTIFTTDGPLRRAACVATTAGARQRGQDEAGLRLGRSGRRRRRPAGLGEYCC